MGSCALASERATAKRSVRPLWRVVVASGAMAVVAYALNGILWHDAGTIWQHVATLSVDIVAAGATFLAAGTLLRVKSSRSSWR